MNQLLAVRDALGRFYEKYDTPIRLCFKFLLALLSFWAIRSALGQYETLNHPAILLGLAVVCTFLPSNGTMLVGAGLILGHFYGISLEAAMVGGGALLIGMLLYFSMAPQSALPLILTALSLTVGLGCAPAVLFGLLGGPLSAMGAAFGAYAYYLVVTVAQNGGNLTATVTEAAEAMMQKMAALIQSLVSNREMMLMILALAAVLLTVYFVRNMEVKYAWMVAAGCGTALYAAIRIAGGMAADVPVSAVSLVLEAAVSLLAAFLAQVMLFSLDYKRTENVRFEDDEYYYYVKAVPKHKVRRKKRRRRSEGR